MKLTQLEYFRTVCLLDNNISKASAQLHVTQPCISASIKDLEAEFHIELFNRSSHRLTLTREGEFFLEEANQLLNQAKKMTDDVYSLSNSHKTIRIGITTSISPLIIPSLIQLFLKQFPDVPIELLEAPSAHLKEMLERDSVDFIVCVENQCQGLKGTLIPLFKTEYVFCTYPENPKSGLDSIRLDEIGNEPLVFLTQRIYHCSKILTTMHELGVEPNIILQTEQISTIKAMISNKCASSFLFKELIKPEDEICTVNMEPRDITQISLGIGSQTRLSANAVKFLHFVENYNFPENKESAE